MNLKHEGFFFFFFLPAQKEIKNSGLNRVDKSHSKILEQEPNERERELLSAFDLLFHVFLDSINIITELETEWEKESVWEGGERYKTKMRTRVSSDDTCFLSSR